jgi:hypothetical protein
VKKQRTRPTRTSPIAPGVRVQTTDTLGRLFSPAMAKPWRGSVTRAHGTVPGAWWIKVDGIDAMQLINEKYLEQEAEQ